MLRQSARPPIGGSGGAPVALCLTNLQAALFMNCATFQLWPFNSWWHYMGGEFDEESGLPTALRFTSIVPGPGRRDRRDGLQHARSAGQHRQADHCAIPARPRAARRGLRSHRPLDRSAGAGARLAAPAGVDRSAHARRRTSDRRGTGGRSEADRPRGHNNRQACGMPTETPVRDGSGLLVVASSSRGGTGASRRRSTSIATRTRRRSIF